MISESTAHQTNDAPTALPGFASTGRHRRPRNWGARAHETTAYGLGAVVLENELLRVTFLAEKGTDVVELLYKPRDLDFVWLSPGGPRRPDAVAPAGADPLGRFVDLYPGGWQEVLPSGGVPCSHLGAEHGQHGEVHLLPWDYALLRDDETEVEVGFAAACAKAPFRLEKSARLVSGKPRLELREVLTNEAPCAQALMWGHHIVFGAPFVVPGTRIELPDGIEVIPHTAALNASGRRVRDTPGRWPLVEAAGGGALDLSVVPEPGEPSELVYLTGFREGWYEIVRPDGVGLRVEWDASVMPYLWFWQECGATSGYPWYGRVQTIGLEPFSSYPTDGLAEAVRRGTALELGAGERRSFELSAEVIRR
jgi:hypothetical protein